MVELGRLRNAYVGETVVFIGNGTSIRRFDLARIRHKVFTCNYFVPFGVERWGLTPDFYLCHDPSVFFVPWEKHRTLKKIEPVVGDVSWAPSPAEYIAERQLDRKVKIILPSSLTWWNVGFGAKAVFAGMDPTPFFNWLPSQIASGAGENIYVYHVGRPLARLSWARIRRFLRRQLVYHGTYKAGGFDPRGYTYAVPSWMDSLLAPIAPSVITGQRDGTFRIPLWGLNSFCTLMLPMIYFLGFDTIILIGVDFDKEGYFFNPYQSPNDRFFYREEYDELYFLFQLAKKLPHAPKIKIVRTGTNYIEPPEGFMEFEEICG